MVTFMPADLPYKDNFWRLALLLPTRPSQQHRDGLTLRGW
jgi:hypothetical protein